MEHVFEASWIFSENKLGKQCHQFPWPRKLTEKVTLIKINLIISGWKLFEKFFPEHLSEKWKLG